MKILHALAFSIAILVAAWVYLSVGNPDLGFNPWIGFVAWAAFFAAGGGNEGIKHCMADLVRGLGRGGVHDGDSLAGRLLERRVTVGGCPLTERMVRDGGGRCCEALADIRVHPETGKNRGNSNRVWFIGRRRL